MTILDRKIELDVTDELLPILDNPPVAILDSTFEEPVENYFSEERFRLEQECLFREMPLLAALSCELPEPGSWKLFDETGVPIILIRGGDGVMRAFLNVCSHRGARLVSEPRGNKKRLSCPYHAWTFSTGGELLMVPAEEAFPDLCKQTRGLRPVQVREHLGTIWVVPNPDAPPMDLDAFLGPLSDQLAGLNMGAWHFGEMRVHTIAANWKVSMDTFTEGYHIPVVHKETIGTTLAGSATTCKTFGDHHRQVFPAQTLHELKNQPREQWKPFDEWRFILTYIIYPNASFMITGSHAEMYQTFPGPTVGTSITLHSVFSYEPLDTEEKRQAIRQKLAFFFEFVDREDFGICRGIERGLRSGAQKTFVFGKNEATTQHIHRAYTRDVDLHVKARGGKARG